jgi:hypothetical protein
MQAFLIERHLMGPGLGPAVLESESCKVLKGIRRRLKVVSDHADPIQGVAEARASLLRHLVDRLPDDAASVRARPGPSSALSVSPSESVFYGASVWARRALDSQKRRFPARAGHG